MKDPRLVLQRMEIKRAREHGFGWGMAFGFFLGGAALWMVERLP